MKTIYTLFGIILLLLSFSSCSNQEFLSTDTEGDLQDLLKLDSSFQHSIRPDDKLSLSIWSHNDMSLGSVFSIYNSNESFGKWVLVDQNGYVQLPKVGKVKIGGLTCTEAADTLRNFFGQEIKEPIIVVKILNRKVTILGEVTTPGNYILEEEQVRLMEAIGHAQGFTKYANMEHLKLVRNNQSYALDLRTMDPLQLHNLMVQSDDLIIATPTRGKAYDEKAPRLIPIATAITAFVIITSFVVSK
jgi:polysaccharide export outer membrane protein